MGSQFDCEVAVRRRQSRSPRRRNFERLVQFGFDDLSGDNDEEDYEEKEKIIQQAKKESSSRVPQQPQFVDFKIVKCDMERALQLLETFRATRHSPAPATGSFAHKMRRTWVREFAESYTAITSYLNQLDNLLEIAGTSVGNKYSPGFLADLVRSLNDQFIPFTRDSSRAIVCRLRRRPEPVPRHPWSSSSMKFHLMAGNSSSDAVEINLMTWNDVLQGRLRKELDKLTLVIPGIVEWRWFLEELYHESTSAGECRDDAQMAQLFQSIHSRLCESFSDAQIDPQEIFNYSQLIFSGAELSSQVYQAHYNYFKVAFLVYFHGNYQEIFFVLWHRRFPEEGRS